MKHTAFKTLLVLVLIAAAVIFGSRYAGQFWSTAAEPRTPAPPAPLTEWEKGTIELFKASAPSVAYITTQVRANPFMGVAGGEGAGSGFVWDEKGHIVTNFHVIAGASRVFVQLDAGKPLPARVIGGAEDYDIAVIQLQETVPGLRPIPIGVSKTLQVGQATFAIGNPFGLSRTLTTGIVSALERRLPTARGREVRGVIQHDSAVNPGNSGGPLLDSAGRLIGVNTAILSESGQSAGISFAIPVDLVNRIVPQLINTGRASRPGIGISAADERLAAQAGIRGVIVIGVAPRSPAERAGIRPFDVQRGAVGDVIVGVQGKPVESIADLATALDEVGVGGKAVLTVQRGDEQRQVTTDIIDLRE